MFFDEIMNKYIKEKRFQKNEHPYQLHVKKYVDYLKIIGKSDRPIDIHKDDIAHCVGYYNRRKEIIAISTMDLHLRVIKDFYNYLLENGKATNIFSTEIPQIYYESFRNDLIKEYNLKEKTETGFFDEEEIEVILNETEKMLRELKKEKFSSLNQADRRRYILCIFIKLTFLIPIKKSELLHLKIGSFEKNFSVIKLNSINVSIPNSLQKDIIFAMNEYLDIQIIEDELFFKYFDRTMKPAINDYFYKLLDNSNFDFGLDQNKSTYNVQKIVDSAIKIMIENGANPALISKIAGISITSIERKFEDKIIPIKEADQLYQTCITDCFYYNLI